ncbi:MAG: TraB/GumN family protein [Candidatus Woesearchaeota archaeon]|nr:TraB/GumN family protein [Candidatus Woesearchaeota archaeon]
MYTYKNLNIIGTSHIAIQSIKEVEQVILDIKPNIVALELDPKRFQSLIHKKKTKLRLRDIEKVGFKGFLFNALGAWIENKLGKSVGILPGSEMKKAVETAYKVKADLALIDQDIEITLKKLSQTLTWKEKFRFLIDILKSLFATKKNNINIDLTKVPDEKMISILTNQVKKRYPSFYKVLIKDRNFFMAKALYNLMNKDTSKTIVAVVGAGHEKDLISIIKIHDTV